MADGDRTVSKSVTAALIVIGDEILSGRTADQNINYIAAYLTRIGIELREVRVVADTEDAIVEAVNDLRAKLNYVFTTGGIGPTHDDITAQSIARAFNRPIEIDERAVELLRQRYENHQLNDARLRMARIPKGASLIRNAISHAPGFILENVIVMAGIPSIMQVMMDAVSPQLNTGRKMLSRSYEVKCVESRVAVELGALQDEYAEVAMGSYPFFRHGELGTCLVLRSTEPDRLSEAQAALKAMLDDKQLEYALLELAG